MKLFPGQFSTLMSVVGIWLCVGPLARAAVDTVTTTADSGPGSLRNTIAAAGPGDTILFSTGLDGQTIQLTSGELFIGQNLIIDASALVDGVTIDGGGSARVLDIAGGIFVNLSALTVTNGYAANGLGGGLYANGAIVVLDGCTFSGNSAASNGAGGGVYQTGGALTLIHCTLSGNSAPSGEGGGIYNYAALVLNNCIVSDNTVNTGGSGGGIANFDTLMASNCTFSANSADDGYGGGIVNGDQMTLDNCTLVGNSADLGFGGGVFSLDAASVLNNCTVCSNSAVAGGYGGGLYSDAGVVALTNTIVALNAASNDSDVSGSYSGVANFVGGNPRLAALGYYGGPTPTMPPEFGSPAIDAGSEWVTNVLGTDQRGFARLAGAHVDIGAVEAQTAPANNRPVIGSLLSSLGREFPGGVLVPGSFQFAFTNVAHADFTVLASTNLAWPPADWTELGNVAQSSPGIFQYTDLMSVGPRQFYRVVSP
jgi:hypothetical protein